MNTKLQPILDCHFWYWFWWGCFIEQRIDHMFCAKRIATALWALDFSWPKNYECHKLSVAFDESHLFHMVMINQRYLLYVFLLLLYAIKLRYSFICKKMLSRGWVFNIFFFKVEYHTNRFLERFFKIFDDSEYIWNKTG